MSHNFFLNTFRSRFSRCVISVTALLIGNEPAWADLAFAAGTERLGNDIMNFLSPLAGIVIIGLGVGAWMGKVSWSWCISFVLGMILVFGHVQILSWLRSLFGF